jgi:hypothetical protein
VWDIYTVSPKKMVALNRQRDYSEVFLRFGQISLGSNPHAEPSLEEAVFTGNGISEELSARLNVDDVFSLEESYGDPMVGDPATFDFLRITTTNGEQKEIEVFNIAILMFMDNRDETRRLFRIINSIKDDADQPATAVDPQTEGDQKPEPDSEGDPK